MAEFRVTSREEVARFFNVGATTVARWVARGMPGGKRDYDLSAIAQWREQVFEAGLREAAAADDGDLVEAGAVHSDQLEEYRRHRARLAKVDADEREGQVVSVGLLWADLKPKADLLRDGLEAVGRSCGEHVQQLIDGVFDEFERALDATSGKRAGQGTDGEVLSQLPSTSAA